MFLLERLIVICVFVLYRRRRIPADQLTESTKIDHTHTRHTADLLSLSQSNIALSDNHALQLNKTVEKADLIVLLFVKPCSNFMV